MILPVRNGKRPLKRITPTSDFPGQMNAISDNLWFVANLNPSAGRAELGIQIPELPPPEIQMRFTGRHGRVNLQQAFDFYAFVLKHLPREAQGRLRLVDFGGGWGRVLRFFLREFSAERLILFDCLTDAVECAKSLAPPFAVQQVESARVSANGCIDPDIQVPATRPAILFSGPRSVP